MGIKRIYLPSKADVKDSASLLAFQEIERQVWNDVPLWVNFPVQPNGGGGTISLRPQLTANLTLWVRIDGNDGNNGLSDSPSGAFLTWQHAVTFLLGIDFNGFTVTVQAGGSGVRTFSSSTGPIINPVTPFVGGTPTFVGDTTTPSNVILSSTGTGASAADTIILQSPGTVINVEGFKLTSSGGSGIHATHASEIVVIGAMDMGSCAGAHFHASYGGRIFMTSISYTVSAAATFYHYWGEIAASCISISGISVTVSGTQTYDTFAHFDTGAVMFSTGSSFSFSTVHAFRFGILTNAVCATNGGGIDLFPGDQPGQTDGFGVYQ